MQNQLLRPLYFMRLILMTIGVLFFLVFGNWSLSHLDDTSMVRGTSNPQPQVSVSALLPR